MGPEELKEWKMRLQHAHNEWRNAGYIPDSKGGSTEAYSMMRYLDAYRGDFPYSLSGGTEDADQMVGNITFSIINTMVAQISARAPDPIVRPIGGSASDSDGRRRAWLKEQIIQANISEMKYKREADMALLSAVLCGFGLVRHGYTPNVEYIDDNGNIIARHKNQSSEIPWCQFMRPWHVRIDPMVNDFAPDGEPRWVAFHNLYFASQIRRNPNLIWRDDLTATHYQDMRLESERKQNGAHVPADSTQLMPMYEEWLIYDAEERKFFGISPGCEKLIREERDWPFDWGQLPYSWLAFNPQLDSPFPIPFPRLFMDEQLLYNRIWTIVNALVSRLRRVIFVGRAAINEEQMALLTNPASLVEFIVTETSPNDAVRETQFGTLPQELIGLLYQLKEQIREVLGVSSFDRGQRANVQTAAEANQIGAGSQITRTRTQEKFEDFWTNIIRVSDRAYDQSPRAGARSIPIIGTANYQFLSAEDRSRGFILVAPEDTRGEFEIGVKLDSTLRIDPAVELAQLSTGFNLLGGIQSQLVNQRYYHERIAELTGADPAQAIMGEEATQQMAQQSAASGQGAETDGGVVSTAQQGLPDLRAIQGGQ